MKNIHLLPTDKPSRLHYYYYFDGQPVYGLSTTNLSWRDGRHIYITSDEEITGFENNIWVIKGERIFFWQNTMALVSNNKPRKIILTTDQDLITDGVQAIDDEFLEWFVKNPSCEFVGIKSKKIRVDKNFNDISHWNRFKYEIIISKEDSKQEGYICPHTKIQCDDECCVSAEDCHITFSLASGMVDCDEPKQETLNKINNMNEEIKKQINLLQEEQTRVKQFINENNFNCTTAPYVIAKQYRDEIKKHIGILKMNLEK